MKTRAMAQGGQGKPNKPTIQLPGDLPAISCIDSHLRPLYPYLV
jgi:hypothetical protein